MKLISLLVFTFLSFNFSNESELSDALIDSIYDYLPYIVRGISSSSATQCSEVLLNKKSEVLSFLKDLITDLENDVNLIQIGVVYGTRAFLIKGFSKNCKVADFGTLLSKIDSEDKIYDIGTAIKNNYENLYKLERDLKKAKDLNEILFHFGKIIYNILNFEFN